MTHFLSFPLVSQEFSAKFNQLKAAILAEPDAQAANIDESIFVDDKSLHLTLAVLKLYSPEMRHKALQVCSTSELQGAVSAAMQPIPSLQRIFSYSVCVLPFVIYKDFTFSSTFLRLAVADACTAITIFSFD